MSWLTRQVRSANRGKLGAIGIEFARDSMHMVQLNKSSNDDISAQASLSIEYPESFENYLYNPAELKPLLKSQLKETNFRGKKIVTAMPGSEISIFSLNYEIKPSITDDAAIAHALKDRIDGDLSSYVVDKIPVRRREDENSALAIVALAEKRKVIDYLECLRKSGFIVDALEIGPSAIQRLISTLHSGKEYESVLTINFGGDKSYLSIISGRRLLFDEQLDFGEDVLLDALSQLLDLDRDQIRFQIEQVGLASSSTSSIAGSDISQTFAHIVKRSFGGMVEHIKRALLYSVAESRGKPVSRIYMVGSIARWRGADKLLENLLGMPVSIIPDPLALFDQPAATVDKVDLDSVQLNKFNHASVNAQRSPEQAVATGLALRGLSNSG